jgi:hypothetical protein
VIRSWGIVTLTGSAQPWFGDVTTAAFVPPKAGVLATVKVANSAKYQVGDRIVLGAGSAGANILIVSQIPSGGVTLLCESEGGAALSAWPNSTIIQLNIACSAIKLQPQQANTGVVYLGSDNTVTNTGGGSAFEALSQLAAESFGIPQFDTIRTSEGWMAGTANDKVGVAAITV